MSSRELLGSGAALALLWACAGSPRGVVGAESSSQETKVPALAVDGGSSPEGSPEAATLAEKVPDGGAGQLPISAPQGIATAGIHVERGKRQPISWRGRVTAINPGRGSTGLESWTLIHLAAPHPVEFRLLLTPPELPLPFAEGDAIKVEIDCRKGGWQRICDGTIRNSSHQLLLAIAGSGDPRLLSDWMVQQGPLALSEARPKGPKSIRQTYAVLVKHARRSMVVPPHEWQLFSTSDGDWFVEGHALAWEGVRPPDATDYLHYAIVSARHSSR